MPAVPRPRRGFALPLVVLVLTLLSLLAVGAIEAARAARRSSALAETDVALQSAAESALGDLASRWPVALNVLAVGDRAAFAGAPTRDGVTTSLRVTRVAVDVWWVTAASRLGGGALAAEGGGGWGRRRINAVLALGALGMPTSATLLAAGSVVVAAPFDVAVDSAAIGCAGVRSDSAVVVVAPSDSVAYAGTDPAVPWRRDPVAGDAATLDRWGAADWTTLVAAAEIELPAGSAVAAEGGCAPGSWGTTGESGCGATRRVVHAAGDLTLSGGSGAGVLLVDGRLRITDAFRFSGLIVARGGIDFEGGGSTITGGVIAGPAGGGGPAVRVEGATALRASGCAVWESLARGAIPRPAAGRWWAELL